MKDTAADKHDIVALLEQFELEEDEVHALCLPRRTIPLPCISSLPKWAIAVLIVMVVVAVTQEQCQVRRRATTTIDLLEPIAVIKNQTRAHSRRMPIRQLSIIGERNSGTRWMFEHLSECFNHSLHVERHLTRYKHWFQSPNSTRHARKYNTLVIAQFRNPYEWLEAMRVKPHHAPRHLDLDWQEFLETPWTMERVGLDLNITSNHTVCQQDFKYNEIVSCHQEPLPKSAYPDNHFQRSKPFYELKQDGSGMPFASIIDMRAAKIRNFLETRNYPLVHDTWPIQYEYLLAKGTKGLLDEITNLTGASYTCNPFPVQHRPKRELSNKFVNYVSEHVDWEAEQLIRYHRRRGQSSLSYKRSHRLHSLQTANYTFELSGPCLLLSVGTAKPLKKRAKTGEYE